MSTLAVNTKSTFAVSARQWIINHPLVAYFVIAFAGTWIFVLPLALSSGVNGLGLLPFTYSEPVLYLLGTLGGFAGPPLAAFVVTAITLGRTGVKELLRRCAQWRAGIHWYLIITFGVLLVYLIGFGTVYGMNLFGALLDQRTLLLSVFLAGALFSLITANFGEEVGWRGFALPRLQMQYGPIVATLILGTLHSLWHLPLLFTPVIGPTNLLDFAGFIAAALFMTFVYTWIFNNTRGSILIAALFHGFSNGALGVIGALIPADITVTGWAEPLVYGGWKGDVIFPVAITALLLIALTKGRLGYRPEQTLQNSAIVK